MVDWLSPKKGMIKRIENDFFKKNAGWKIHLAVDEVNQTRVYHWLLDHSPYSCKYKSADEDAGKDFTIYIGGYDETEKFVIRLEREIGNLLKPSEKDAKITDLGLTENVCARFQPPKNGLFGSNGYHGIPLLFSDASKAIWDKENLNIENALKLSYQQLSQIYGKYFTGSKNQVLMKLAKYVSLKGL
ncbi:hypothetical protein J4440_01390 [Candidatus Woesearchaeota archaeon]|nr:hypothetical protein [Candidatus Woesearchaeota archaeon]